MSSAIFPVTYLAPVSQFALMANCTELQWDIHEYYHKQFLHNHCLIGGANGLQKLIVPVQKKKNSPAERLERTPIKDVEICYDSQWQKNHWRSFEAAYRRSPYFEYYEQDLFPLYMNGYHPARLLDWNVRLFEVIAKCIGLPFLLIFTHNYTSSYKDADDYRSLSVPGAGSTIVQKKYHQVFEEKHGFLNDLSIADLLFCEGPHTIDYLRWNKEQQ